MTKNEAAYLVGLLDLLNRYLGNAGCNDMFLPDTPENRALVSAAEGMNPEWPIGIRTQVTRRGEPAKIATDDLTIAYYLKHLMIKEYDLTREDIPDIHT